MAITGPWESGDRSNIFHTKKVCDEAIVGLNFLAGLADRCGERALTPQLFCNRPMIGFIALPSLLVLVVATLLVIARKRRAHDSARTLGDLSPVSGQWLSDYRRSG